MTEHEDTAFFNKQDGVRGRDGGPYGDVVDAEIAEERRARGEGREPDFDNLPPTVGQHMVTAAHVEDNTYSNPSMAAKPNILADALYDAKVDAIEDQGTAGFAPQVLGVDTRDSLPDAEFERQDKASAELNQNPANVATTSNRSVGSEGATAKKSTASKRSAKKRTSR